MRVLVSCVVMATMFGASPSYAQDWLSGIARGAARSAAQALTDRAVTTVTNSAPTSGTSPAQTPSAGAGRPEMYDAQGDRIYRAAPGGPERFDGQALWRTAAQCAALHHMVEVQIAETRAFLQAKGWPSDINEATTRAGAAGLIRQHRDFGLMRLQIDQGGSNTAARFDEEMRRQVELFEQADWSADRAWRTRADECDTFYSAQRGLIYNMQNGRGDGSRAAPGR